MDRPNLKQSASYRKTKYEFVLEFLSLHAHQTLKYCVRQTAASSSLEVKVRRKLSRHRRALYEQKWQPNDETYPLRPFLEQ